MSKPRLSFLGVGWIGQRRLEMVAASGAAEIALIWDTSPNRIEEARKISPESLATSSYEEMLEAGFLYYGVGRGQSQMPAELIPKAAPISLLKALTSDNDSDLKRKV